MLNAAFARLRALLFPSAVEREIDDELRAHLDQEVAHRVASGEPRAEAERAVRRELGNVTLHREDAREAYGWRWLDELRQDLRYAFRNTARTPVVTSIIVLLLAVGIGPNAALISFIDARLSNPVPGVADPAGLAHVSFGGTRGPIKLAPEEFERFSMRQRWFNAVANTVDTRVGVTLGDAQSMVDAQVVSASYFRVMRLRMAAGSGLSELDDGSPEPQLAAVINYRFWQTEFGGSRQAVGRSVIINGSPVTIVGVMPKYFDAPELTLPYTSRHALSLDAVDTPTHVFRGDGIIGRLRPGIAPESVQVAVTALASTFHTPSAFWPAVRTARVSLVQRPVELLGPKNAAALLPDLTLLILLITCANASILLLGRAVARRREIAVRLSMGASRARIIRQLLTETALLGTIACAAALLLLVWMSKLLWLRYPAIPFEIIPSWTTVGTSLAFSTFTGLAFGLAPALHATRVPVGDALKDSAPGHDARRTRLQRGFVVAEVALSMMLVSATVLVVNGVRGIMQVQGYAPSPRVQLTDLDFAAVHTSAARAADEQEQARRRIAAILGVRTVGFADGVPLSPEPRQWELGYPADDGMKFGVSITRVAQLDLVDPGFFGAMQMPLIAGRDVSTLDAAGAPPVAIVSADIAAGIWPSATPLGRWLTIRRMIFRSDAPTAFDTIRARVVGIVGTVRKEALLDGSSLDGTPSHRQSESAIYLSRRQWSDSGDATLIVESDRPTAAMALAIERALRAVDPRLPFTQVLSATDYQRVPFTNIYAAVDAATLAGALVLLLACVGIYAVIAFGIGQRSREIGIRLALGAHPTQVVWLFFRDGMRLSVLGFGIGIPLAVLIMKLTVARKFGVAILAPSTVMSLVGILLAVVAMASWLPARRAASVDALAALRSE